MLYEILASKTHNAHYLTKYINFIKACQAQNESYTGYTERHHICPKAQDMFPEFASFKDFPWNCALLTPRQHYIAHLFLLKTYPTVASVKWCLSLFGKNSNKYSAYRDYRKGLIVAKTTEGPYVLISKNDPEYLSGAYKHPNKNKISVIDRDGNTFQTDVSDIRYITGKVLSVSNGKVVAKDYNGNNYFVSISDPRYLSGELKHVNIGKIAHNRRFTPEEIRYMRIALRDKTINIPESIIYNLAHDNYKQRVGMCPYEELKYKNLTKMSYSGLLSYYFSDYFGVSKSIIYKILKGETYKKIII